MQQQKNRSKTGNGRVRAGILAVFVWSLALLSCEKEVKVNISSGKPKLVVEGAIETGLPPYVILTHSIGYFSKIDLSTVENSFVHGAIVKVSDGTTTIQLKEYGLDTGINNIYHIYTVDTTDPVSLAFEGEVGKNYKLSVEHGGKVYQSETSIPYPKPVDAIWYDSLRTPPADIPGGRFVYIRFTDPDTPGNCIRYFTRRNGELFYSAFNSVYDDEIVNGTRFDLNLPRGFNKAKEPNLDSLQYFFVGDTVTVKWCTIDHQVFDFWRSFEIATSTVGNPFASPIQVSSNISNGALGVWAGYGATYSTVIIRK